MMRNFVRPFWIVVASCAVSIVSCNRSEGPLLPQPTDFGRTNETGDGSAGAGCDQEGERSWSVELETGTPQLSSGGLLYDAKRDRYLAIGSHIWTLERGGCWQHLTDVPITKTVETRGEPVIDEKNDRLFVGDTLIFDLTTTQWSVTTPPYLTRNLVYDSKRGEVVALACGGDRWYGGQAQGRFGTHAFRNGAWVETSKDGELCVGGATAAYDRKLDRIVLHGGSSEFIQGVAPNEIRTLTLYSTTRVFDPGSSKWSGRFEGSGGLYSLATYDPIRGRVVALDYGYSGFVRTEDSNTVHPPSEPNPFQRYVELDLVEQRWTTSELTASGPAQPSALAFGRCDALAADGKRNEFQQRTWLLSLQANGGKAQECPKPAFPEPSPEHRIRCGPQGATSTCDGRVEQCCTENGTSTIECRSAAPTARCPSKVECMSKSDCSPNEVCCGISLVQPSTYSSECKATCVAPEARLCDDDTQCAPQKCITNARGLRVCE